METPLLHRRAHHCQEGGHVYLGWLLVFTGFYVIARHFNWIGPELPFWGLVLLVTGIVVLLRRHCR